MTILRGRFAEVTFEFTTIEDFEDGVLGTDNFTTQTRVQFDIEKFSSVAPNSATIDIYNLSPENRVLIESRNLTGTNFGAYVTVRAGYDSVDPQRLGVIFRGRVNYASTTRDEVSMNTITKIEALNGIDLFNNEISLSFLKGTLLKTAIKNIITVGLRKTLNTNQIAHIDRAFGAKKIKSQWVVNGKAGTVLNDLNRNWPKRMKATFDEAGINFMQSGVINSSYPVIEINKNTGMIRSPTPNDTGVILTTVLKPEYNRNQKVVVQSTALANLNDSGNYVIDQINYRGDSKEGEFLAQLTCVLPLSETEQRFG